MQVGVREVVAAEPTLREDREAVPEVGVEQAAEEAIVVEPNGDEAVGGDEVGERENAYVDLMCCRSRAF